MPRTRSAATNRPEAPAAPRTDRTAEHAAITSELTELAARVVQFDAVDRLELGDLDGAEQCSQRARETAVAVNDLGGLALATATLAAVRAVQGRSVEAQAMWVDAELFDQRAPDDPRHALTRRLLDILGRGGHLGG